MVEVGNTPPSSLPLGLPLGEVAVNVSLDSDHSLLPRTPMARVSFLKDKVASLLRGAAVQTYFGPDNSNTNQQEEGVDYSIVCVGISKVASGSVYDELFDSGFHHVEFRGYYQMYFNSDPPSVPSLNGNCLVGLDVSLKVQHHKSPFHWYLVLTMMTALILGTVFKLNEILKSTFIMQGAQSSRYSLRKNMKARHMSITRSVRLAVFITITLTNVVTLGMSSSAYALEIGESENLINDVRVAWAFVSFLCHSSNFF